MSARDINANLVAYFGRRDDVELKPAACADISHVIEFREGAHECDKNSFPRARACVSNAHPQNLALLARTKTCARFVTY